MKKQTKKQLLKERFQQLAGIKPLYEDEVPQGNNNKIYTNDNGTKFRPISKQEFGLEYFGVVGVFKDRKYPDQDFIVAIIYDGGEDFDSDAEEKAAFSRIFRDPSSMQDLLWDKVYDDYRRISNKDRFSLERIIPVTYED